MDDDDIETLPLGIERDLDFAVDRTVVGVLHDVRDGLVHRHGDFVRFGILESGGDRQLLSELVDHVEVATVTGEAELDHRPAPRGPFATVVGRAGHD